MDLRELSKIQDSRIACSKYSDLDDLVIAKASELGLPLIGGTALELLSNYYNVQGVRKRSDNDLDFLSDDIASIGIFQDWLQENIDPSKVQVDVYTQVPKNYKDYIMDVDGILVMKPQYLIWSKLTRWSDKDIQDIKWLLTIPQMTDKDLNTALDDLGVTQEEFDKLVNLL